MTKREIEFRLDLLKTQVMQDREEIHRLQNELKRLNEEDSGQQSLLLG